MSCYLRHMKSILEGAGIETQSKKERKNVDLAIRHLIGQNSNEKCPVVWREVKIWINDEKKKMNLINDLKEWNKENI